MVSDKEKIERLTRNLGSAYNDVKALKTTNVQLKTKNAEIIAELTKSNEALAKLQELVNNKKTETDEISPLIDTAEEAMTKLQDEINELKAINTDLESQVAELKTQSAGVFTKSLAILGFFAGGAWAVMGINTLISRLRGTTGGS